MNTASQRVQTALLDLGPDISVIHVEESARTAEQAAAAVNAGVGQIVKSLVFHPRPIPVVCDRDHLDHDVVWAAAGTPHHVFPIDPATLVRITGAQVAEIALR